MRREEVEFKWEKDKKFRLMERAGNDETAWAEAIRLYEEALNEQPNNPEYLFLYGSLLETQANQFLRKAAECYEKGLESEMIKRDYDWVSGKLHAQLIHVRAQLLEINKSIEFYKEQLRKTPDEPKIYCYLAQCYLKADQIHEAEKVVKAGLKLFPTHAMLVYNDGEVHSRNGRTEEALQAWERSAQLDPLLIDGRFMKAYLLEREKRLEEAAREWGKIVEFMEQHDFRDDFPLRELERIENMMEQRS